MSNNNITEIKGLDNLVNLNRLYLNCNQINEIKGLDNLTKLYYLKLDNKEITSYTTYKKYMEEKNIFIRNCEQEPNNDIDIDSLDL